MFAAAVVALYSTFGPIAQDAQSLYVVQNDSVVRVSKDDPAQRTTLTPPVSGRIAALDVDGDRLFYATAPAPRCVEVPVTPSMLMSFTVFAHGHRPRSPADEHFALRW